MDGWCPQGEPWAEAAQRVNPDEWERIKQHFPLTKPAEQTAALLLYSFTGLTPTNQDDQQGRGGGYDGAVDVRSLTRFSGHLGRAPVFRNDWLRGCGCF